MSSVAWKVKVSGPCTSSLVGGLRIAKVFSASESPILLEAKHLTVLPFMSSVAWKVKVFLNCMVALAEKESSSIFRSMSGMGLPPLAWQDTTTQSPTLTSSTELPATNNSNFGGLGSTLQVGMLPFQNQDYSDTCKRRHASELFLVHKEYQAFRSDRRYFLYRWACCHRGTSCVRRSACSSPRTSCSRCCSGSGRRTLRCSSP